MARLRSATPSQNTATAKPIRQALKDRTNTAPRKAPVYEDDGDAEPLVKDARPKRTRGKKAAQDEDPYVMAGGLGLREVDENATAQGDPPMTTDELAKSDGPPRLSGRGSGLLPPRKQAVRSKAQPNPTNAVKSGTQQTTRRAAVGKKSKDLPDDEIIVSSSEALPAKTNTTRKSNQSRTERSGLSLSPSPPPTGHLNSVKRSSLTQPGSALRVTSTPAVESSILALKNFKRRPRQPSMLQMVQQRTASARPSAVNTNTTEQVIKPGDDSLDLDDEDDFAPDAEGTPVVKKTKAVPQKSTNDHSAASIANTAPAEQSKKRKSDETDKSLSALDALRMKRRRVSKPDDAAQERSREASSARRSSSTMRRTPQPELTLDVQVINSSSSTPPTDPASPQSPSALLEPDDVVPSTEKEQGYIDQNDPANDVEEDAEDPIPNATMADPVSSSPLQSSPPQATQQTDIMADPLTQISPPKPKLRDKKPDKKARPLDTATLQSLLPKRRKPLQPRHRKSEYDFDSQPSEDENEPIDTSHLDSDEDELGGHARRQTKAISSRKSTAPKSRKSKAAPSRKSTTKPRKSKASKPAKTYGRNAASDKENDEAFEDAENDSSILPDTSISGIEAAKSAELEAQRLKFAALDDFEMSFESIAVEEGRSSSQLWR